MKLRRLLLLAVGIAAMGLSVACLYPEPYGRGHRREGQEGPRREHDHRDHDRDRDRDGDRHR